MQLQVSRNIIETLITIIPCTYNDDDTMQISHGFIRIALYGGAVAETNRHEFTDNNVIL